MHFVAIAGTVAFAISGVLAVSDRRLDWFGAVVVGLVTALGGGTVRDLVLDVTPVFWVESEAYLLAATGGAIAAIATAHALRFRDPGFELAVRIADAAGLALFSYVGANATLDTGHGPLLAVTMAVVTGVGGGVMRDVLSGRTPLVMTSEIYATAALAGAVAYVGLVELGTVPTAIAAFVGMTTTLLLRLASLYREWSLPLVAGGSPPQGS